MKKILYSIIIFTFPVLFLGSCIRDESLGATKILSEIDITTSVDTIYADYGFPVVCDPEVSQSQEGLELSYEWRASFIDKNNNKDSLSFLSDDPILNHSFKKLGKYGLRLQVSNDDGSSFKYFTVFVRSAFEAGIFVLSANETGKGMVSFLRLLNESEVVAPQDTFLSDVLTTVNPTIPLNGPVDAIKVGDITVVLSKTDQKLYYVDNKTFDINNVLPITSDIPGAKFSALGVSDNTDIFMLLSESGEVVFFDKKMAFTFNDYNVLPDTCRYDKLYNLVYLGGGWDGDEPIDCQFLVNYGHSQIDVVYSVNKRFECGDIYAGQNIVNLLITRDNKLRTISVDREDQSQVNINTFEPMDKKIGAFKNPTTYSYRATSPLTLDVQSNIVSCNKYYVAYYYKGNKLYRWEYTLADPRLPETPVSLDFGGNDNVEICSITLSPDQKYLYLGIYDKAATTRLKGGVYVYDADNLKLIKKFDGISDRPVKVFYRS